MCAPCLGGVWWVFGGGFGGGLELKKVKRRVLPTWHQKWVWVPHQQFVFVQFLVFNAVVHNEPKSEHTCTQMSSASTVRDHVKMRMVQRLIEGRDGTHLRKIQTDSCSRTKSWFGWTLALNPLNPPIHAAVPPGSLFVFSEELLRSMLGTVCVCVCMRGLFRLLWVVSLKMHEARLSPLSKGLWQVPTAWAAASLFQAQATTSECSSQTHYYYSN